MPRLRTAIHSARDRGVLPQYRPDGNVRQLVRRLDMLAPISTRHLIALLDGLHIVVAPQPSPAPPPPEPQVSPRPEITVRVEGAGGAAVFVVDGVRFARNATVIVRVVDDALAQRAFQLPSDGGGVLRMRQSIPCVSGLALHFSATDGRRDRNDLTGVLWSNTVTHSCP
ncbi:hypothetical protein [Streptomyces omiyaensis]|uniref:Uncharacterized protein n=1 Tax=Streptomyces omiyaensis TaxID=68247 RepID=A0ABW7BU80_9ACTN|nr:hypothetical protein [Streptomyces omiyaensis]GGY50822.1 hypothetical protein GCM10010363_34700 [Streptomyces omiyaensis]